MKLIILTIFAVFFSINSTANAATCQKTGTVCVDSTPCKTVSGDQVCLAGIPLPAGALPTSVTCWQYQDTYNCIKPDAVNYCQPFINAAPSCWQTSSVCAQMDTSLGTGCMQYTQTYQCGNSAMPTAPTNTIKLADTYTLVSTGYDTSTCPSATSSNCTIASSACTSTTPSPPLPLGINPTAAAPDGCYQQSNTYTCMDNTSSGDCGQYSSNPNCSPQSSNCEDTLPNGTCAVNQQTYSCMTTPASTTTTNDCSATTFCQGGKCFNTGSPADNAFATAAALMEAGRQGGVYNQNGVIFSGEADSCRIRLFGAKDCCTAKGGGSGYSNNAVMGFVVQAGGEAIAGGSRYVYDALYESQSWFKSGMNALNVAAPSGSPFQPSLSIYGVSATWTGIAQDGTTNALAAPVSTAAANASAASADAATAATSADAAATLADMSATIAADTGAADAGALATTAATADATAAAADVAATDAAATAAADTAASSGLFSSLSAAYSSASYSVGSAFGFQFAFNPYALAFAVAVMVYEDLTSCNQQEQMLGLKRGQNLCTYTGTYCSQKVLGSCMENTNSYCCYNSLLAKIIEEQGRAQIGKGYGSAQSPDCSGLTTAQFKQIDFSKIDLSQFTALIMASVVGPNQNGLNQNASGVVQKKIQNYYNNGSQ